MSARTQTVRGRVNPGYICPRGNRGPVACKHLSTATSIIDSAVWERVEAVLTKPEIVAEQLAELRRNDPATADLAAVETALSEIGRRRKNLSNALALFTDPDAAAPVVARI